MKPLFKVLIAVLFAMLLTAPTWAAEEVAPSSSSKQPVKKKIYELPKTGLNQPRPSDGWINVEAVGTRLVIKFFDKEKKPVAPDVERGTARFKYAAKNPAHAVLNRDGLTLVTPATVRPPHNYLVILTFFKAGATEATESHTLKYP